MEPAVEQRLVSADADAPEPSPEPVQVPPAGVRRWLIAGTVGAVAGVAVSSLVVLAARPFASTLPLTSRHFGKSQELFERDERDTEGPTLFCWSVMREHSYEQAIVEAQLSVGAGIFECDGQAVFSERRFKLNGGFETQAIGALAAKLGGAGPLGTGSWVNTDNFFRAWAKLQEDWQFDGYDFVVKTDPDTVFLPALLKQHLVQFGLTSDDMVYLNNCPNVDNGFYGAAEVASKAAFSSFMEGLDQCRQNLPYTGWGEDLFAQKCMEAMGVRMLGDYDLIKDGDCHGPGTPPVCTPGSPAYHPFKDTGAWLDCWKMARAAPSTLPVQPFSPQQRPMMQPMMQQPGMPAGEPMMQPGMPPFGPGASAVEPFSPPGLRGHFGAPGHAHRFPTELVTPEEDEEEPAEGNRGGFFGGLPSYHRL